ncbi:hypothetical protein FRC08_008420 [Ceratobasidium sp. 394]|nr:hypothetical protein FRC08_008420 [Ceratobasidium sp. 394]
MTYQAQQRSVVSVASQDSSSVISISDSSFDLDAGSVISISDDSSASSVQDPYEGIPELNPGPDDRNWVDLRNKAGGLWQVRPRYGTVQYRRCLKVAGRPLPRNTWSFSYDGLFDAPDSTKSQVGNIHYSTEQDGHSYWVCCIRNVIEEEGGEEGEIIQAWVPYELGDPHPLDRKLMLCHKRGGHPFWSG